MGDERHTISVVSSFEESPGNGFVGLVDDVYSRQTGVRVNSWRLPLDVAAYIEQGVLSLARFAVSLTKFVHSTTQSQTESIPVQPSPYAFLVYRGPVRLLSNPHRRHPHPRPDTHTTDSDLLPRPSQLIQQRAHLPRTRATERMPERDGAALGVDLLHRQPELFRAPDALTGERFVDLVDVNIFLRHTRLLQRDRDRFPWTDTHEERGHADHRCGDVLAQDLLA